MRLEEEEDEIEEELVPRRIPDYGAYAGPMEFLHGARAALEAGLLEPARVLAREAVERARKAAAAQRERLTPEEEDRVRRVGEPRSADVRMDLVDDLAYLAGIVEKRVRMARRP